MSHFTKKSWSFCIDTMIIFWIKVESNKEHIAAALETLRPTSSWERTTAAGQGVEGVSMGGRGFGVAMDALIKYLGPEHGVTFAMGTVVFLKDLFAMWCLVYFTLVNPSSVVLLW